MGCILIKIIYKSSQQTELGLLDIALRPFHELIPAVTHRILSSSFGGFGLLGLIGYFKVGKKSAMHILYDFGAQTQVCVGGGWIWI